MTTRAARRLAIALAVSIGLNLFLSGMIASAWMTKRHYADRHGRPPVSGLAGTFDFRGGLEAAGPEARPLAREIRRAYGPRLRESGRAVRDARKRVGEILQGDALDRAALAAAFRDLRQATDAAQATMHEVMIETMTRLTPEQRRAFLEGATQKRPRRGDRPLPPPEDAAPRGE